MERNMNDIYEGFSVFLVYKIFNIYYKINIFVAF